MMKKDARYTNEIKSSISTTKAAFYIDQKLGVKFKEKILKCYILIIALCCAATWTVTKVHQNCLERFEMWCCRRIEVII
jgi:hypothetical protein